MSSQKKKSLPEPILQPQALPLFTTTQPASHGLDIHFLENINAILAEVAGLERENAELRRALEAAQGRGK